MSDVPRSLQRWVSIIQPAVLTATFLKIYMSCKKVLPGTETFFHDPEAGLDQSDADVLHPYDACWIRLKIALAPTRWYTRNSCPDNAVLGDLTRRHDGSSRKHGCYQRPAVNLLRWYAWCVKVWRRARIEAGEVACDSLIDLQNQEFIRQIPTLDMPVRIKSLFEKSPRWTCRCRPKYIPGVYVIS